MNKLILETINLSKTYHDAVGPIPILTKLNFQINTCERIAIVGRSGSGKSTLLHLLGGLDKPSQGQVQIRGTDWQKLTEKERCQIRSQRLGFIYQFHHLLPEFSALENVAMPLLLQGQATEKASAKAKAMLTQVGLATRLTHRAAQLSGGERQRVAIARALVHNPACILADEPTGNLDQSTATAVFDLMLELNHQAQTAIVIVTHDKNLAARMDRTLVLQDGALHEA